MVEVIPIDISDNRELGAERKARGIRARH